MSIEQEFNALRDDVHRMKAQLETVGTDIKEVKSALLGDLTDTNKTGVLVRIDRLEQTDTFRSKTLWVIATSVIGLIVERFRSLI